MSSQEKPQSQGPQGAPTGMPNAMGHSDASPPSTDTTPGGAAESDSGSCLDTASYVMLLFCGCSTIFMIFWVVNYKCEAEFKVESISVFLQHNNIKPDDSRITAKWDVRLAIENPNFSASFGFETFDVWIMSMYQSFPITVPPFIQGPRNTTFWNATAEALFSHRDLPVSISALEVDVIVRAKYSRDQDKAYTVEAVCMEMKVAFFGNATKGIMVGEPTSCEFI